MKRDSDLKLQKISQRFEDKCRQQVNDKSMVTQPIKPRRLLKVQDRKIIESKEKVLKNMQSKNSFVAFIHNFKVQYFNLIMYIKQFTSL